MSKDTLYRTPINPLPPFEFNKAVADVFDDMILRSVPMYAEILRRQAQMIENSCSPGMRIYDLGCSTGNLALTLCDRLPPGAFTAISVDTSQPMLDVCKKRLAAAGRADDFTLLCRNINQLKIEQAAVVAVNFTLQFIPFSERKDLLRRIHDGLIPGGMLLISEKTIHPEEKLSALEVDFYYRFKRENGYSEMEISQKREALENVLVPETVQEHHQRFRHCGFTSIDLWLKWFNFCSWICIK